MKESIKIQILLKTITPFVLVGALVFAPAVAGGLTLVGEINDENQLMTPDGKIYDIADTMEGSELFELTGESVSVTGTVEEEDGVKTITVESHELMDEEQESEEGTVTKE